MSCLARAWPDLAAAAMSLCIALGGAGVGGGCMALELPAGGALAAGTAAGGVESELIAPIADDAASGAAAEGAGSLGWAGLGALVSATWGIDDVSGDFAWVLLILGT
jgi:hypothetical protein